jgi:predicted HicB family RNase H-like nuclease
LRSRGARLSLATGGHCKGTALKTTFPLRLTGELKELAAALVTRAGVSLNQYIATLLAAYVGV